MVHQIAYFYKKKHKMKIHIDIFNIQICQSRNQQTTV